MIYEITGAANDYFEVEPKKFDINLVWFVDSININNNHCFYSIFLYHELAYCYIFQIAPIQLDKPPAKPSLKIHLNFKNPKLLVLSLFGDIDGKVLTNIKFDNDFTECPSEKQMEFVYTDYVNVVVLKGGDSRCGPHIMVLGSHTSRMTYEERMNLIEPKISHSLDFKSLKQVEPNECKTMKTITEEFKEINLRKCRELIEVMKKEGTSEMIQRSLMLALIASGLLYILINGLCWVVKHRNWCLVNPVQSHFSPFFI